MFIASDFKRSFLISLLGHLGIFILFSFSFGRAYLKANNSALYFLGQTLRNSELTNIAGNLYTDKRALAVSLKQGKLLLKPDLALNFKSGYYVKPQAVLSSQNRKLIFFLDSPRRSYPHKESVIMLRPMLPHYFILFFNDRKNVHLELQFNIISEGKKIYAVIKRKITSGNLEADLLSMRYISHYLFIQNNQFPRNSWQTIKIDLSAN